MRRTRAQWTRVTALPADWIFSVRATGDTIVAGRDSVAWVSTNGGVTWRRSAVLGTPPAFLDAVLMLDGRIWAGTGGQGVFTSDNLGTSWQLRNSGLAGGVSGSHLYVQEFRLRRDTLYAATDGAGVFRRPRFGATAWSTTGNELISAQAGSIVALATDGSRLLAAGGANGLVFTNDGGAPWTATMLGDSLLLPGLSPTGAAWTGTAWLVGTDYGLYRSATGRSPWTFVGLNYAPELGSHVVSRDGRTFVAVNRSTGARFLWTDDDGVRWQPLEQVQTYVTELEYAGGRLWAALGRTLVAQEPRRSAWRRSRSRARSGSRSPAPAVAEAPGARAVPARRARRGRGRAVRRRRPAPRPAHRRARRGRTRVGARRARARRGRVRGATHRRERLGDAAAGAAAGGAMTTEA
ncbi:MAG: hypothetical protein U0704_05950 [Candidatus Eisenbacteria bacterium]